MKLSASTEVALRRTLAPTVAYSIAEESLTRRQPLAPDESLALTRICALMTFEELVQLTRETRDWCAWRVLLVAVTKARARSNEAAFAEAEVHLRALARRLLDAQSFSHVDVDDVLAHPTRIQASMRLFTESLAHGRK